MICFFHNMHVQYMYVHCMSEVGGSFNFHRHFNQMLLLSPGLRWLVEISAKVVAFKLVYREPPTSIIHHVHVQCTCIVHACFEKKHYYNFSYKFDNKIESRYHQYFHHSGTLYMYYHKAMLMNTCICFLQTTTTYSSKFTSAFSSNIHVRTYFSKGLCFLFPTGLSTLTPLDALDAAWGRTYLTWWDLTMTWGTPILLLLLQLSLVTGPQPLTSSLRTWEGRGREWGGSRKPWRSWNQRNLLDQSTTRMCSTEVTTPSLPHCCTCTKTYFQ